MGRYSVLGGKMVKWQVRTRPPTTPGAIVCKFPSRPGLRVQVSHYHVTTGSNDDRYELIPLHSSQHETIAVTSGVSIRASELNSEIEIDETDEIRRFPLPFPADFPTQSINYGSCTNLNSNGTKELNFVVACPAPDWHSYMFAAQNNELIGEGKIQCYYHLSHVSHVLMILVLDLQPDCTVQYCATLSPDL